ncbi:NAC domain-containing protein 54-like [Cornus florida]|uniref:NAC domain-containing protein 54-like n=1 Tax=Cornus florida TaxID=4283 RepID=UPI00289BD277|nr:NAC domain-containing protein 54-like [Cornus florida]
MAQMSLPPGFRFHPTDEELVAYYLNRKITGRVIELEIIPEVDLYKCEPWDLPDKSYLPGKDMEWYFYSPTDRKYPNGSRTNRATKAGYWKATGKDRVVQSERRRVGTKKTLVYYKGRAPHGIRTNWVMHEYRLINSVCGNAFALQDSYALCRIFKKTVDHGPKTTEQNRTTNKKRCQVLDKHLIEDQDTSSGTEISKGTEAEDKNFDHCNPKYPSDASSSDLTQGTPLETCQTHFSQAPFTSDEDNSLADMYSFGTDWQSNLVQDIQDMEYTSMQHQPPYPPLAVEDFPKIDIAETKPSKPESIDEYVMYDKHRDYMISGTTMFEDILFLCSS